MKTDREFLDGIYQKARLLEESSETKTNKINISFVLPQRILGAIAAVFMLVAVPSVTYAEQPRMKIPEGYTNLAAAAQSTAAKEGRLHTASPQTGDIELFEYSDVICTGKVIKIEKSVYEKENQRIITNVQIKPDTILKGESVPKVLTIQVSGGYDDKTRSYIDYETVFTRGEDVLVFLDKKKNTDSYILYGSKLGKYTYLNGQGEEKSYIDGDEMTVSISGLKVALF